MRRFWTSANRDEVTHFSALLKSHGIKTFVETTREADWDKETFACLSFSLWIDDERDIPKAKELFSTFSFKQDAPSPPHHAKVTPLASFIKQSLHVQENTKAHERKGFPILTYLLTLLCILCFIGTIVTGQDTSLSPLQAYLLFDDLRITPHWEGLISFIDPNGGSLSSSTPLLFESIRHGQLWRLCTPIFLHANLLHLVFNMIWVISLGSMIELRTRALRYLLLIFAIATISNTAQYLVSGPAFLGISGVICGMAGFVTTRQRLAPWESYPLPHQAYQFLIFWVWLLIALSGAMLFLALQGVTFAIGFGNTAHVSGLLAGKILGRFSFFSSAKQPAAIKFV